ncbi:MAG: hypothetical protein ACE5EM_10205 [Sphingomonadales bacterium]
MQAKTLDVDPGRLQRTLGVGRAIGLPDALTLKGLINLRSQAAQEITTNSAADTALNDFRTSDLSRQDIIATFDQVVAELREIKDPTVRFDEARKFFGKDAVQLQEFASRSEEEIGEVRAQIETINKQVLDFISKARAFLT